ncbi:MAG: DNA polymerase IV [Hyphomicrobiales bacterium]
MILHIDMDAFYASVEQLDNPWLRGRCVIVGGTSGRGVVSAASYEARKFGVRSAMPVYRARQLCPQGVFIHPRMDRYQEVSGRVMEILREFSPLVEPVSIDEAFLDLTGTEQLFGSPAELSRTIKNRIREAVHLTCSVGAAPNRFLAKVASDFQKPDGLTVIQPDQVAAFIDRLPIDKVPGVGPRTQPRLEQLGVRFLGDIRRFPEPTLESIFGAYGRRLLELSRGIDPTPVTPDSKAKSVSSECTLEADTADPAALTRCLLEQADEVAAGLRKEGVKARTVVLKIRHADFKRFTRRTTFDPPTQSSKVLYRHAARLLREYRFTQKVRLVGLGATGFVPVSAPQQQELFAGEDTSQEGWEKVDRTLERIKRRYGEKVIRRASLKED